MCDNYTNRKAQEEYWDDYEEMMEEEECVD